MKPRQFRYLAPRSLDEVYRTLAEYGDEARILAGGQSLVPMMNFRVASPAIIVDINECESLRGIARANGTIRIGALTRYCELETSSIVKTNLPIVSKALPHVAHLAIRNRGTIGGSLALADPAAEMPACALLLGASIELGSENGIRTIPACDFFDGSYSTALRPNEAITAVVFPEQAQDERHSFMEVSRRHGDFAIAGIAARRFDQSASQSKVDIVGFGLSDRPVKLIHTAHMLAGCTALPRLSDIKDCLGQDVVTYGDSSNTPEAKFHIAAELLRRTFVELNRLPN